MHFCHIIIIIAMHLENIHAQCSFMSEQVGARGIRNNSTERGCTSASINIIIIIRNVIMINTLIVIILLNYAEFHNI